MLYTRCLVEQELYDATELKIHYLNSYILSVYILYFYGKDLNLLKIN